MRTLGIWLVVGGVVACSKTQPVGGSAPLSSGQAPAAVSAAAASTPAVQVPAAEPTAAAPEAPKALGAPPASFKGGNKETIGAAVGLGCEATTLEGWLQLLCRKKNGTGGHPVRALVKGGGPAAAAGGQEPSAEHAEAKTDAAEGEELTANEQGELTIVVPYSGSEQRDVSIEWTDTAYTLHVSGPKATLEWVASGVPHRRACQQLLEESKAALSAAQKLTGEARLTTSETAKLPRFGVCQPGGLGSWALSLKSASGKGEGASRQHHLELDVVRVDVEGARKSASFGSVDFAAGGFELAALQAYDYDDDGRDELIVPYEIKATGGATPTFPPAIWSFGDAGVAAYAKSPTVNGGLGIEQLDFDMRPDFGSYGPFVAYLGADCGLKACPGRVTGPKLYLHSVPDGSFSDHDDAARNALKRAGCQNKPSALVVEAGGSVNVGQTAKNLICAKAYGAQNEDLAAELSSKHAALCGEAATCPLLTSFEAWSKLPLPVALTSTLAKK